MRSIFVLALLATLASGQSMVENAAAAAGGSVGGVAGRTVGNGLANIFGKVDRTTSKAAKTGTKAAAGDDGALMEVGPGVPKGVPNVPPPPPLHRAPAHKAARARLAEPARAPEPRPVPVAYVPPPEPRQATLADLQKITGGMTRARVLDLAPPSARITMIDSGHLLEIYRYLDGDANLGTVRLLDGAVSEIHLR
jgi:flagellar hook-basal body complex protein FliE